MDRQYPIDIQADWLGKYSKWVRELRQRYVVLKQLNANGDRKAIYTFKSKEDSKDMKNATETIIINDVYNVIEYFSNINKLQFDDFHFIVNDKFIFKCKDYKQRHLWIEKIITTNNNEIDEKGIDIDEKKNVLFNENKENEIIKYNCDCKNNNNESNNNFSYSYKTILNRAIKHTCFIIQ